MFLKKSQPHPVSHRFGTEGPPLAPTPSLTSQRVSRQRCQDGATGERTFGNLKSLASLRVLKRARCLQGNLLKRQLPQVQSAPCPSCPLLVESEPESTGSLQLLVALHMSFALKFQQVRSLHRFAPVFAPHSIAMQGSDASLPQTWLETILRECKMVTLRHEVAQVDASISFFHNMLKIAF